MNHYEIKWLWLVNLFEYLFILIILLLIKEGVLKCDLTDQNSNKLLTNQTKDERRSKRMLDTRKVMTQDKIQMKKVFLRFGI